MRVEALGKEDHDYKTFNLLLDLVFAGNLFAAHAPPAPPAVVLYLDAAGVLSNRDRLSGEALLVLLDFLATCSTLTRQQALNDLSLVLEKSDSLRAFFLSTPSWQPRLLRLLPRSRPPLPQRAPSPETAAHAPEEAAGERSRADAVFYSLPSVVTWGGGMRGSRERNEGLPPQHLQPAACVADGAAEGGEAVDVGVGAAGGEEEGASGLVGLVGKILSTVAHDMMLVPNGWRVMAHCLDSLRQGGLFDERAAGARRLRAGRSAGCSGVGASDGVYLVRGMICAACKVKLLIGDISVALCLYCICALSRAEGMLLQRVRVCA